jgi:hypothetical protein
MLQNAANYGKLVENFGNFGGARFGPPREVFSREDCQKDFPDREECCKNTLIAGRRARSPGFPAELADRISFDPPGGISCI